ncbi:hypothetical protein RV10_GL000559 [Enterococcus pallens]|nr:hypothetical protein RV10_GL000559 [Enterococcus pallens]
MRMILSEVAVEKTDSSLLKRFEIAEKENMISGNNYEIRLRNKMNSAFIARETSEIIRQKVLFKKVLSPPSNQIFIENFKDEDKRLNIAGAFDFTGDGLGIVEGEQLFPPQALIGSESLVDIFVQNFNSLWEDNKLTQNITDQILEKVKKLYQENTPEWIYFVSLYHIFHEQLDELDEKKVIKEGTGFKDTIIWNKLYQFQKDGVVGLIEKLEKYNGAILADSVGLGKTFSALAVIKYYELRNDRVLVLAPKRLKDNWTIYTQNDIRNVLNQDRFNYDVLNHTDLSRYHGFSGNIDLRTINWGNYDLVVIDESHNFRNNVATNNENPTRYHRLMKDIIKSGVKTKVLMLSATPVNNRMNDIKNQIAFITEDNSLALQKFGIDDIDQELRKAQNSFNRWSNLNPETRTTRQFLDAVNPGYFKLLDMLTIARSRKHIEKYYDSSEIGEFPERLLPKTIKANIDEKNLFIPLEEVNQKISELSLALYTPMSYVMPQLKGKYESLYDIKVKDGKSVFKQVDREQALTGLIRVNLLKRMESSIHSFRLTLERILQNLNDTIVQIDEYKNGDIIAKSINDFSEDDIESMFDNEQWVGKKTKILLGDMDLVKWRGALQDDRLLIQKLYEVATLVTSYEDSKLNNLKEIIRKKIIQPINPDNKKIIIFTAFSDTAEYLYNNLSEQNLEEYGLHTALITGSGGQKTTIENVEIKDMNDILLHFSPVSKGRSQVYPDVVEEIDILIATDTISEGQNLQDADFLINYDIHWNPVRVIQRFGRIDRIGSRNSKIQLVNFWPNMDLDEYINLENRVRGRMVLMNASATGEDDILNIKNNKEMNDLSYRKNQLRQLQNEVLDLEDVNGAISITDVTFTDFKADLSNAIKSYEKELLAAPKGMFAITDASLVNGVDPGVILILKQNRLSIKKDSTSLLPYLLIYMNMDGTVKINHTHARDILNYFKQLTINQDELFQDLIDTFNEETDDGKNMDEYSFLLNQAIAAIKGMKEEQGRMSLFSPGGTNFKVRQLDSVDEVELISFLIIREG